MDYFFSLLLSTQFGKCLVTNYKIMVSLSLLSLALRRDAPEGKTIGAYFPRLDGKEERRGRGRGLGLS